jgi:hypothetical protein
VAVAASKKKKAAKGSGWSWRLAGFALCAFFTLGVATGLSGGGHELARRVTGLLHLAPQVFPSTAGPTGLASPVIQGSPGSAIALVERGDGFYTLDSVGGLRGPVSPANENDMPILSGAALANASSAQLLTYASILVRAEASFGAAISEMRCDRDDGGILYLERPPLSITIDFAEASVELERANQILALWRGHRDLLVAVDMTVPGQAVVSLRPAAFRMAGAARRGHNQGPEVTASR